MARNRFFPLLLLCFLGASILSSGCGKNEPPSSSPTEPVPGTKIYALQINRYAGADLDSTGADAILRDATLVLQTEDGTGDAACPIELRRLGGIGMFSVGNGTVNSNADFDAILQLPGHVKVVNQINWCGAFKPNIIGCAPQPGNSLLVIRHFPSEEGILWAHELGHNNGLGHRDEPNALMKPISSISNRMINEVECAAFTD